MSSFSKPARVFLPSKRTQDLSGFRVFMSSIFQICSCVLPGPQKAQDLSGQALVKAGG